MGNKRLWFPSRLIEIRFDWWRSPEDLGCRHGERKPRKTTGQVICKLITLHGNFSEMRGDMINLVSYRDLMTYY